MLHDNPEDENIELNYSLLLSLTMTIIITLKARAIIS